MADTKTDDGEALLGLTEQRSFPKIISGRIDIDPERWLATNAPARGILVALERLARRSGTLVAPP
jgi:hypothetical protein